MRSDRSVRIILALLPVLLAAQCSAPFESPHGTQLLRAEPAGTEELFPTQAGLNIPMESAALNDSARFLAGLPAERGRDAFVSLRASEAWKKHRSQLDGVWSDFAAQHGSPVNSWARSEIGDLRSARAVFYPFSGPDFLFAQLFYPKAETYVLCGLEPCEPLPAWSSLSPEEIGRGLDGLVNSLGSILHFSYFITKDMRQDLQATRFRGVLPVFMVFLARTGHAIESVDAVRLDGEGNPVVFAAAQSTVPGFLIRARGPAGPKRIFYFSQDLSNGSVSPNGPFLRFVSSLGKPAALVKSASYLMHEGYFSNVRNHLLTQTCGIVQDPSGVAFQAMRDQGLRLSLYGNYRNTIDIFRQYEQPDLAAAYADPANHPRPLNFGIGYLMDPRTTCLIVARPR
jgi:hypothetical protein